MRYSFSKGEVKRLEVENTRLSNSTLAIVLVSVSVGGFILEEKTNAVEKHILLI